jgi:hypothetical protein
VGISRAFPIIHFPGGPGGSFEGAGFHVLKANKPSNTVDAPNAAGDNVPVGKFGKSIENVDLRYFPAFLGGGGRVSTALRVG